MRRRTQAERLRISWAKAAATRALRSIPRSLLIANAVLLTAIVDALLWYRWAVTQNAGWLFAAGVLSLLVLTLLLNPWRFGPRRAIPSSLPVELVQPLHSQRTPSDNCLPE